MLESYVLIKALYSNKKKPGLNGEPITLLFDKPIPNNSIITYDLRNGVSLKIEEGGKLVSGTIICVQPSENYFPAGRLSEGVEYFATQYPKFQIPQRSLPSISRPNESYVQISESWIIGLTGYVKIGKDKNKDYKIQYCEIENGEVITWESYIPAALAPGIIRTLSGDLLTELGYQREDDARKTSVHGQDHS